MKIKLLTTILLFAVGCSPVCKDLASFPGIEEKAGKHHVRIYLLDPGLVLQELNVR